MRPINKLRLTAALLVAATLGIGCNPLTGTYFMLFGIDDKVPPEFKIAGDGKKIVHAVVMTASLQESNAELFGIERELTGAIIKSLETQCRANKEKIKIIPVHKVEEFKSTNPGWRTMTANDIARKFDVDYVIQVEVASLTLYERDSRKQLFRGRSALNLYVFDVTKPADEGAVFRKRITVEYPKARGPMPVDDDMTPEKFRDTFFEQIATQLGWHLTSHVSTASLMQE